MAQARNQRAMIFLQGVKFRFGGDTGTAFALKPVCKK